MLDVVFIESVISNIDFVKKIYSIENKNSTISGKIGILFDGLSEELIFEFKICLQYPLKYHNLETIHFYNTDLIKYNHVMEDGAICIHTSHNTNLEQKLQIDFNSLKQWIEKYYINKGHDLNYEHIIVPECLIDDAYYSYIFTNIDYTFKKDEYGKVAFYKLNDAQYKETNTIHNYIVQSFISSNNKTAKCQWNENYANNKKSSIGLFYFLENHPAKYGKFILKNWKDFDGLISDEFIDYIYQFNKEIKSNFPVFIGYKTVEKEIHWQVAILKYDDLPIQEDYKESTGGILLPIKKIKDAEIKWAITIDSSYKYFFGRGVLYEKITNAKILIIGIGAIGSMIAKTLVRGGCKHIDISDYGIKEPENVCRSEYMFVYGIVDKVKELMQILSTISPFININYFKNECFELGIKNFYKNIKGRKIYSDKINEYDIVFDCTTDNDLMYILDSLKLKCDLINISITNHAKELVCGFNPNTYHFVNTQFNEILENNITDLYEPTGCWSPTFKASYNDINALVQLTIKRINNLYKQDDQKNNFIVTANNDGNIDIREY